MDHVSVALLIMLAVQCI